MQILTTKTFISPNDHRYDECILLCTASRMLRNVCLYNIRQKYFESKSLFVFDSTGKKQALYNNTYLYHQYKDHECFRTDKHPDIGRLVPTKVLKQVYINLQSEFTGYIEASKSYNKNPTKFTGRPKIPSYNKDLYRTRFPKDALSFKKPGYVHLSMTDIYVPIGTITKDQLRDITIVPCTYGMQILVSYAKPLVEMCVEKDEITRICGIDLGLNNLASLTSNDPGVNPIIINGRVIKSINQYYNKILAKYKNELPNNTYISTKIKKLTQKRNFKIDDYLHKASTYIINYLLMNGIHCLVVGSNKQWKRGIKLGKKTNQNFVSIPYYKFKSMLKYKCRMYGIYYIEREESYTSKCSFIDLEDIKKHTVYRGRRIKRGLFRSSDGSLMNADTNAAYNIIRKEYGNEFFQLSDMYKELHIIKSSF